MNLEDRCLDLGTKQDLSWRSRAGSEGRREWPQDSRAGKKQPRTCLSLPARGVLDPPALPRQTVMLRGPAKSGN